MALVSIREAARLTGKSVHTIYRRIRNGGLSSTMTPQGETKVDIAELTRVFGDLVAGATASTIAPGKNRDLAQQQGDIQLLQARLEAAEARLQTMQLVIETKDQLISVLKQNNEDLRLMLPSPGQVQQPAPQDNPGTPPPVVILPGSVTEPATMAPPPPASSIETGTPDDDDPRALLAKIAAKAQQTSSSKAKKDAKGKKRKD